ncbi:unnamed protein product [Arabidopsis lyrata]|nr:unnamed protein product [Arabidopsis lyrata]
MDPDVVRFCRPISPSHLAIPSRRPVYPALLTAIPLPAFLTFSIASFEVRLAIIGSQDINFRSLFFISSDDKSSEASPRG